jgi:hypothetical protein
MKEIDWFPNFCDQASQIPSTQSKRRLSLYDTAVTALEALQNSVKVYIF